MAPSNFTDFFRSCKTLVPDSTYQNGINIFQITKKHSFIFKSKKKDSIPNGFSKLLLKKKSHKFTEIPNKKQPQALLFILNDRKNAAGMISMLESYGNTIARVSRKSTANSTIIFLK